MNKILKFLIIAFFINCFSKSIILAQNSPTRFVVVGHLYPIIENKKILTKLINKINSYNPEYIFILGDSGLENKEVFKKYKNNFNSKLFFSPGNHELKKGSENFFNNVGYFYKEIVTKDVKFVLINSSDNIEEINNNLGNLLKENFDKGPTVLLTHHRIWDDTLISAKPMEHDKSFYFEEIFPYLDKRINYIFSGNSKRQYFRDLSDGRSYGKQNVNNILWLDKIDKINAYSIGMGDGKPKANFVIVDVVGKELMVRGDFVTIEEYKILPKKFLQKDNIKLLDKYNKENYFFINKKKLNLTLIIFFILIFFFVIKKKTKN